MNSANSISVILCTYNNAESLAITLAQLSQCKVQNPGGVEILVVDNNSSDHTHAVTLACAAKSAIPVKYLFQPRQGLSHARNLGLQEAMGRYALFTDDDADIPQHWLSSYQSTITQHQPDCLYSKIDVIWEQDKPWWFDQRYNAYFVQLDYGDRLLSVADIHHEFFGKNFCCRKDTLIALGGFDTGLGRNGKSLAAGEETLLYLRLISNRHSVIYFPDACVGHRLKPAEYTVENIEKKIVDGADSSLKIASVFATKRIFGKPTYPLRRGLTLLSQALLHLVKPSVARNRREKLYWSLQLKRSVRTLRLWVTPA